MLDGVIRNLVAMHPRGVSSEQLLWRMRRAGLRPGAAEVLGTLTRLAESGELKHKHGRWQLLRGPVPEVIGKPGAVHSSPPWPSQLPFCSGFEDQ